MELEDIVKELEKKATLNGVDLFIDDTTLQYSFIPVINDKGVVGAVGQYLENNKVKIGFFILNDSVVRYALSEGFEKDQIYNCFKKKLFKETDKSEFFKIMVEKNN